MSTYIILPVIAFTINVATMSYIAAIDYRRPVIRAYLLFTGVFTVWIFLGGFFYVPVSDDIKMTLVRFSSPFWFFTGFAFYHFTVEFFGMKRTAPYFTILAAACAAVTVAVATDLVIAGHRNYPWGWRFTEGTLFNAVTLVTIIIPVAWSWVIFFRAWMKAGDPTRRTQLGIMVSGILISLVAAAVLQYLFPLLFGMDRSVRYNSQTSCILSSFIFYAIIRYRFLSPGVRDVAADLFATIGEGLVIMDSEGKVLQMNPAAMKILGVEGIPVGEVSLGSLIEDYDPAAAYYARQTVAGPPEARRQVLIHQSEIRVRGSAGGRILIINDISGIASLDAAVRESEARFSMIAANVSDVIWICDLDDFRISYVSPSVVNIQGWSAEEFIALPMQERMDEPSLNKALQMLDDELTHDAERPPGRSRAMELREHCKNGGWIETEIKVTFIRGADGRPTGLLGVTRDITQRKILEHRLEESLRQLRERTGSLERDLLTAQTIQRALLPDGPPSCPGFRIDFKYLPLEAVGGDYFSIITLEEGGLAVFLGDVAGHGVPAALFLSLLKSESGRLLREYAFNPGAYLARLNAELLGNMHSYFITAVYGLFVPRGEGGVALRLVSAGHPPPVLQRSGSGGLEYLEVRGKVLGVMHGLEYEMREIPLVRGDRVFFYTDGLSEMRDGKGELLGFDRLLDVMRRSRREDLARTLNEIIADVNRFRGEAPLTDDTVIIGIEVQ